MQEWTGICEFCRFQPTVTADNEEKALVLLMEVHRETVKNSKCPKGPLILAAFKKSDLP